MGKKKKSSILSSDMRDSFSMVDLDDDDDEDIVDKNPSHQVDGPWSWEDMQRDADNFEEYVNIVENFAIIKNLSPETYKKAIKTVKKMIKYLREGRGDKVYDRELYEEYLNKVHQ